ncbi:MAG TPA: neutral/alkaline non-lysosomal ceramidase N-terminal domain-containing protein, partial [Thermodesulfobacteriota bacterium]|nr:neutral/alkaline non-lysosomal ceramidase N-terminal domain-containing protein [Thermodesulfobacteriota bacterium]
MREKITIRTTISLLLLAAFVLVVIGPWPAYGPGYQDKDYFRHSITAINKSVEDLRHGTPYQLIAGWGVSDMTPKTGIPLAGYRGRHGKPSIGVHDRLHVKALVVGDGHNMAVIIGADMLLVPDNIADAVRKAIEARTPLKGTSILFTATHTHSGPGAFAPGLAFRTVIGKYDPTVAEFLIRSFIDAIDQGYRSLKPAKIAHGHLDAKAFIRNRTRRAGVDDNLNYAVIEREDGQRCYLTRFSAHPTILGSENFELSGDYPGFLQQTIEQSTGATALYLGGAVGSMKTQGTQGDDAFSRAKMFGETLARMVIKQTEKGLCFQDQVAVASIGAPIELPPLQLRLGLDGWRVSPFFGQILGIRRTAWLQAVRIGNLLLIGTPGDFSGEISVEWRKWAAQKKYDLWVTSFCGSYAGYISPDKYYDEITDKKGSLAYEIGLMSWCGPNQEAYFTDLMKH